MKTVRKITPKNNIILFPQRTTSTVIIHPPNIEDCSKVFIHTMTGDALKSSGILEGDLLICTRSSLHNIKDHSLCIVLIDGYKLARFLSFTKNGKILLYNDTNCDERLPGEFQPLGIVIRVDREVWRCGNV